MVIHACLLPRHLILNGRHSLKKEKRAKNVLHVHVSTLMHSSQTDIITVGPCKAFICRSILDPPHSLPKPSNRRDN